MVEVKVYSGGSVGTQQVDESAFGERVLKRTLKDYNAFVSSVDSRLLPTLRNAALRDNQLIINKEQLILKN